MSYPSCPCPRKEHAYEVFRITTSPVFKEIACIYKCCPSVKYHFTQYVWNSDWTLKLKLSVPQQVSTQPQSSSASSIIIQSQTSHTQTPVQDRPLLQIDNSPSEQRKLNVTYGVSACEDNLCIWTSSGELFIQGTIANPVKKDDWGKKHWGVNSSQRGFFRIDHERFGGKVISASVGYHHIAFLTDIGQVWVSGCNEFGQLGLDLSIDYLDSFKRIPHESLPSFSGKIIQLSASHNQLTFLTDTGQLYRGGSIEGLDIEQSKPNILQRVLLPSETTGKITLFSSCSTHTVFLTDTGEIWYRGWTFGDEGSGINQFHKAMTYAQEWKMQGLDGNIIQLVTIFGRTMLLTNRGQLWQSYREPKKDYIDEEPVSMCTKNSVVFLDIRPMDLSSYHELSGKINFITMVGRGNKIFTTDSGQLWRQELLSKQHFALDKSLPGSLSAVSYIAENCENAVIITRDEKYWIKGSNIYGQCNLDDPTHKLFDEFLPLALPFLPPVPTYFDILSDELFLNIIRHLDLKSLIRFSRVNQRIHSIICNTDEIWQRLVPHLSDAYPSSIEIRRMIGQQMSSLNPELRGEIISSTMNLADVCWMASTLSAPNIIGLSNGLILFPYSKKILLSQADVTSIGSERLKLLLTVRGLMAISFNLLSIQCICRLSKENLSLLLEYPGYQMMQQGILKAEDCTQIPTENLNLLLSHRGRDALVEKRITVVDYFLSCLALRHKIGI